tara:strand:+ start:98 stop:703 length:606 start_codon:yes stop_codon:yes gene_type:complete
MQREIETKFDIPTESDTDSIIKKLEEVVQQQGFTILTSTIVEREFQYYDTPNFEVYKKGETIRRVGGFNPEKSKGIFRYDFKIGPIENRYEANHWTNKILEPIEILEKFDPKKFYTEIYPSASASTQHHKIKLQREETLIEASIDYFSIKKEVGFKELELELEKGTILELNGLSQVVQKQLELETINKQKYSRVLEYKYNF